MKTIEEKILGGVWELVLNGVNDALESIDDDVPAVERRGDCLAGDYVKRRMNGTVGMKAVQRTEKERIVRLDAYAVEVTFNASLEDCYRYAYALDKAIEADATLGGLADRVLFVKKVYNKGIYGCEAVFSLRVTVEGFLW
jgi:hypothetical protein